MLSHIYILLSGTIKGMDSPVRAQDSETVIGPEEEVTGLFEEDEKGNVTRVI